MYSSLQHRKWILESSSLSVDQPLEVVNVLGAYDAFLLQNVHVGLVGTAVDCGNLFVENIREAAI